MYGLGWISSLYSYCPNISGSQKIIVIEKSLPLPNMYIYRIAGVSGALAVSLCAYGSHGLGSNYDAKDKKIFKTGTRFHMLHTLAILGCPCSRRPLLSTGFFIVGILLFSGACYVKALSKNDLVGKIIPVGGTILIFAWLSLLI
ncbi:unnamed protein product [Protopolystoma xenopodis]|uniref:Transmembrane protein 256 homolog n=1 Tax=Protopolystoma xenopodis TaxID=117903 RepID=A0A448WXV0_9PLAT|nr:unnamed protein product [Protopolystoma xenopodis]